MPIRRDREFTAVRGHDVETPDMVGGVAVTAPQRTQASTEAVGDVPDAGCGADRCAQPVICGNGQDISSGRAGRNARHPTSGIDPDVGETASRDEQAAVHGPVGAVPGGLQVKR